MHKSLVKPQKSYSHRFLLNYSTIYHDCQGTCEKWICKTFYGSNEKVIANLKEKTQKVIKKSDEGLKWRIKINKEGANQE